MANLPDRPIAPVLIEAQQMVEEQLVRLRALVAPTRAHNERRGADLRLAERQFDEALLQQRAALSRNASNAPQLSKRSADLRARCADLRDELDQHQHALRQIEQLIRQIEMSSDALSSHGGSIADPWALALRAQVIHGREEERARLAREVHDGPAQVLANSLMVIETCYMLAQQGGNERLEMMLGRLRDATREGMSEVRRFIANLRSGALAERGLTSALQLYIRDYIGAYDAAVSFESEVVPPLAEDVQLVFYRIVQEALQNVHKYARGAQVAVRLAVVSGELVLTVRDNGPGFDPHEVARRAGRSNWGLVSMRERAELVGAQLTVTSRPAHGTEVSVVLPIENESRPG